VQYFPIFVDGEQLSVLVVGGGEVATRKVELMLKTPAQVTVVSPKLTKTIAALAADNRLTHIEGRYNKRLLEGKQLVFVATADNELNQQITHDARAAGVLANVVDSPALCHFITPSIVDRSPMIFAISSEGKSPVLVRYWRERLETLLPQTMGAIATFAGNKRSQIKQLLNSVTKRRNFWELFFSSSRAEQPQHLDALYDELIAQVRDDKPVQGELYVVQGTNTPDNLSLAGLRHMQKADIAVYDRDIAPAIIELVRRDAEREVSQDNVESQIFALINQGLRVCYIASPTQYQQTKTWDHALRLNSVT